MKLRVRSVDGGDTQRINLSENGANLQALKEAIASKLNSPGSEIDLSLNKKDALQGPPEEPLQSFGITTGDLVFYSLNRHAFQNNTSPVPTENPEARETTTSKELNDPKDENSRIPENPKNTNGQALTMRELCASAAMKRASSDSGLISQQPAEIAVDTEKEMVSAEPMEDDNEILKKSRSIPYFLERVLLEERVNATNEHAFLIITVHAVMLELGFLVFNAQTSEASLGFRLSHGWATKALVSLRYTLPELVFYSGDGKQVENAELKFSVMGKFLVVYGGLATAKGSQHCRLSLDVSKYFPSIILASRFIGMPDVGKSLERKHEIGKGQEFLGYERVLFELWKVLKDGLCMRVYTALCEKAGLPLPPSLIMLPTELKMLILQGLPAVDIARMGCVCTEFRFLASNDELWKQKYLDELWKQKYLDESKFCWTRVVQRWKDAFARAWMERKRADPRRRRTGDGPVWQPPRPLLRRFPFPYGGPGYGIRGIGGDYDRFPAFGDGTLFGGGGMGGRLGLGGGSLPGGSLFRRPLILGCDLNEFGGHIDAETDPDLQLGSV